MPMRTKHLDITAHPTINIIILPACQIISLTNTIRCVWGAMSSGRRWANPIVAAPIDGGADTPVGVVVASDSEVEFCARGVLPHLQPINVIKNVVTHAFECIFIWMLWERVVVDKNPPLCLCYAFPASEDICQHNQDTSPLLFRIFQCSLHCRQETPLCCRSSSGRTCSHQHNMSSHSEEGAGPPCSPPLTSESHTSLPAHRSPTRSRRLW